MAYVADNSAGEAYTYAQMIARSTGVTDGDELGGFYWLVSANGSLTTGMSIVGAATTGDVTVDITTHDGSAGGLMLGGVLVTATATELNYVDGVSSAIQTQIDGKSPTAGHSSIATVGTITTGIWQATDVAVAHGGTGASSAADARTNLGVDAAGTDNSTAVTLAGSLDYITISGQEITRNAIDLAADVTGTLPASAVQDKFLRNDASDTTTGTITAGGFTTTGTWTFDEFTSGTIGITTVQDSGTTFDDNDTSLMTAAAIADKIEAYSYSTTTGTVTSVATAGTVNGITLTGGAITSTGTITLGGTLANITVSQLHADAVQTSGESFADNDTSLMTSAAIADKIEAYGYSTTTGDITGVTAGTGLTGGGASGAVTLTVDINGTADLASPAVADELLISDANDSNTVKKADLASIVNLADHDALTNFVANEHIDWTGASAGTIHATNYTDTTYTKASFDLDHLFTLVGASADTDEHLSTFTGSTISDNQTIKQALQALETAVETKGAGTVDVGGTPTAGHVAVWTDADTITFDSAQLFWDTSSNELGVGTSSPGSTLHVSGSVQFKAYTVGDTGDADWDGSNIHELHDATKGANHYILCDTGNTNRTVELPDASSALAGRTYVIKKIDSGTGTVTIQPDDNDGTDGYLDRDNATVDDGTNILWVQFDTISCTCAEGYTDGQYEWHIVHEKIAAHTAKITMEGDSGNISNATETQVLFDNLDYAVGCGTAITGSDRKVTINRNGKYSVKCQIAMNSTFDSGDRMSIYLYKNGSLLHGGSTFVPASSNQYVYGWMDSSFALEVDDYLQIKIIHWNGENADIYNKHEDGSDRTVWDPFLIVEEIR